MTNHCLRQWIDGERQNLKFGVPMVWREPKNHYDDCYFCLVNIKGIKRNNKIICTYPDLESAIRPVPHSEDVTISTYNNIPELTKEYDGTDILHYTESNRAETNIRNVTNEPFSKRTNIRIFVGFDD